MILCASSWNYQCAYGEKANLEEAIREIVSDGFGVEVWMGWMPDEGLPDETRALGEKNWEQLAQLLEPAPAVTLHTAYGQWDFQGLKREIDFCSYLNKNRNGGILVAHAGTIDAAETGANRDNGQKAVDYAQPKNVVLALENGEMGVLNHALGIEGLKICIDIGHANLRKELKNPILSFLDEFRDHIVHLHLADNLGQRDDHFTPGEGEIDWSPVIAKLTESNFEGTAALEINGPTPRESALKARDFLSQLEQR